MKNKHGFSAIEIMIVVAIIGLLAAIAIPNSVKAREFSQKFECAQNLKRFEEAKTALVVKQQCPSGGTYTKDAQGVWQCPFHTNDF